MTRKIMVVFGTRPEAVKLAPVIRELEKAPGLRPVVVVTGQHREMLDQMLATFAIRPAHDLGLMKVGEDFRALGVRVVAALMPLLGRERPDVVVVQGDTTTTVHAALAAHYRGIPCGHVEAGLRSFDDRDPFPEELNRRLTTRVATWHFAPTEGARHNLLREGVAAERIAVTGNTVVDALQHIVGALDRQEPPLAVSQEFLGGRRLLLATSHRRESFGVGLRAICAALRTLAERHEDLAIVYPLHLNPAVQEPVRRLLGGHPRIALTAPLEYLSFVSLMRRAHLILTDSGGIQEEAPALRIPVLVMRNATERPEGVEAGVAEIVGTRTEGIVAAAERLLSDEAARAGMVAAKNPYGDGRAAAAIIAFLQGAVATLPVNPGRFRAA